MVEPVLKLSQRAYLGAQAVEVLENDLEAALSLLEEVLKVHPTIPLSRKIRPFIKEKRSQ